MKELEFMELLGELPAEYIEAASNPQKTQRRLAWLRYGIPAMAACIAVVILAAVYPRLKAPVIPSVDSRPDISIVTETGTSDAGNVTTAPDESTSVQPDSSGSQGHRTSQTSTVSETRSETDSGSTAKTTQSSENAHTPTSSDTQDTNTADTSAYTTKSSTGTTAASEKPVSSTSASSSASAGRTSTRRTETTAETTADTHRTTVSNTYASTVSSTASNTQASTAATTASQMTTATRDTGASYTLSTVSSTDTQTTSLIPSEEERKVIKWKVNTSYQSDDEMNFEWGGVSSVPRGDDYDPIRDFDYDSYDLLLIHLYTNAADADLTAVVCDPDDTRISGMVYRQESDTTTWHFIFAVPVPKGFTVKQVPEFNFEITDDADYFSACTDGEPDITYN